MPRTLRDIWLYPIKSLDGLRVDAASIAAHGSLANDRTAAIMTGDGAVLRAKDDANLQRIRSRYDLQRGTVQLAYDTGDLTPPLSLHDDAGAIGDWLSDHLGKRLRLIQPHDAALPDDPNLLGPTIVSTGSLDAVGRWFDLPREDCIRRFRVNLVYDADPFDEDQLIAGEGDAVAFRVGDVDMLGVAPCGRCPVPARDWQTGEGDDGFVETFIAQREAALPSHSPRDRFKHFYYLTTRTTVAPAQVGRTMRVGDELTIGDVQTGAAPHKRYAKFAQRVAEVTQP